MKTVKNMKQSRFILFVLSFLMMSIGNVYAQNIIVTGTVLDSTGEPVIGANVKVAGNSSVGTITDFEGNFSLSLPADTKKLEISYIGMLSQETVIKPGTPVKVILKEDTEELDEVVVIGYGTVKKRDLTGSMTSIKQADIVAVPTTNALESLQGKVAGLDMTKSSGQTGSGLSFSIRGNRSLNASNAPLIIVDGVPYGTDIDINPNVIESMEILKDASSTAIYGSRGANGVILITTKKGAVGKTKVSYNGYYSSNSVAAYPDRMNLSEWADFKREAYRTDGQWASPEDDAKIFGSAYDAIKANQNVDWVDVLMQTGSQMSHSINISNGTEKTTFNLAFEYMSEDGLVKLDNMDRYNATLSLSHKLTDNLKLNANVVYTYLDQNIRRDPFNRSIYYAPYGDVYNEDGSINVLPFNDGQTISPIAEEVPGAYKNNRLTSHLVGNVGATWNIIKDLTLTSTFGFDKKDVRTGHFADTYTLDGAGNYSLADVINHSDVNWSWENTLAYSFTLGKHNLSLMAGNALYKNVAEEYKGAGHNLISSTMLFYNLGGLQDSQQISSNYVQTTMASFFGRLQYEYDNRYLMTASIRRDGSSKFGKNKRWGIFPAVSLAYRISNERFWPEDFVINSMKVRGSWGANGNNSLSDGAALGLMSSANYSLGGSLMNGYAMSSLDVEDLTWEKVYSWNVGADFSLFNSRLSVSLDYYQKKTSDLLYKVTMPGIIGFSDMWDNVGEVQNKGFELELQSQNLTGAVRWSTSFNMAYNKNEVTDLGNNDKIFSNSNTQVLMVGQPMRSFYMYDAVGVYQYSEDLRKYPVRKGTALGDVRYRDVNDDGVINDDDRTLVGKPNPDFTFGMTNKLSWKAFDLSVLCTAQFGGMLYSMSPGRYMDNPGMAISQNVFSWWKNMWRSEEEPGDGKTPALTSTTGELRDTRWLYSSDYIRIKNITLGYKLPLNRKIVRNARVYFTVENVWMWDKYDGGYSPENKGNNAYPQARTYTIGANFSF